MNLLNSIARAGENKIKKVATDALKMDRGDVAKKVAEVALDGVANVGKGTMGFVGGMTHSEEVGAPVVDPTKTQEWRNANAAIRSGQGDTPMRNGSLWDFVMGGPTPRQTQNTMMQDAAQRQQQIDDYSRQQNPGQPTPTEQRMLAEANRYNPKAQR